MSWQRPPRWEALRRATFERWGRTCWRCGSFAATIDHVVPLALGGTNDPANLRPACGPCNYGGGARLTNRLRRGRQLTGAQRSAIAAKAAGKLPQRPRQGRSWPASRHW